RSQPEPEPAVFETESVHNIIRVEDASEGRLLFLNFREGPHTILPKEGILTGAYYDKFLLGPKINQGKRVLFLWGGGGTALRQMTSVGPEPSVLGVDLDPAVLDVARDFFGLKDAPRIELLAADARWFADQDTRTFDIVAHDLYDASQIPFYCTTAEFFAALA